ncbi:stressosome-associated protein Prli42 [Paenibacillus sp. ACRRX]|nr:MULTISPECIES: stressosome-associated protein Prli42 [Paenibacillus]MCG7406337.1 stressosome-associated protein Prli42 [Paenibacillus sp. ACRRX]MDK8179372.1 stressosome-associated protein Prli42 [Paenibacillus sp. UMB4589-SE434]
MNKKRWFRIIVYLMLIAMVASTLFVLVEPFLYGL